MKRIFLSAAMAFVLTATGSADIQPSIPYLAEGCGMQAPLHCAAARGDLAEAQRLLDGGASLNAPDDAYRTPLHWAVQYGQREMITFLLDRGADVDAADRDGNTPLFYTRRTAILALLLNRGAGVDAQNHLGHTVLHLSAFYPSAVDRLLSAGAGVSLKDANNQTPLDIAGMAGQSAVVARMIRSGGSVAESLHLAVFNGQVDVVKIYLKNSADIHTADEDGNTLLHKALMPRTASLQMVKYLLANGADVRMVNRKQETPLHLAVRGSRPYPYLPVSACLIEAGADVNAADRAGMTPFLLALSRGGHYHRPYAEYPALIRLLLKHGAALDQPYRDGRTPLHFAAGTRANHEIVALLVERGCPVGARDQRNRTPLHLAASVRRLETQKWIEWPSNAEELLVHGADIHARDRDGRTPLHVAAEAGRLRIVSLLLQHGADRMAQDHAGAIALDKARERKHSDVLELLSKTDRAVQ